MTSPISVSTVWKTFTLVKLYRTFQRSLSDVLKVGPTLLTASVAFHTVYFSSSLPSPLLLIMLADLKDHLVPFRTTFSVYVDFFLKQRFQKILIGYLSLRYLHIAKHFPFNTFQTSSSLRSVSTTLKIYKAVFIFHIIHKSDYWCKTVQNACWMSVKAGRNVIWQTPKLAQKSWRIGFAVQPEYEALFYYVCRTHFHAGSVIERRDRWRTLLSSPLADMNPRSEKKRPPPCSCFVRYIPGPFFGGWCSITFATHLNHSKEH